MTKSFQTVLMTAVGAVKLTDECAIDWELRELRGDSLRTSERFQRFRSKPRRRGCA